MLIIVAVPPPRRTNESFHLSVIMHVSRKVIANLLVELVSPSNFTTPNWLYFILYSFLLCLKLQVCQLEFIYLVMGITKQYLRYKASSKCNLIGSTWARLTVLNSSSRGEQVCAVGACEDVLIWNLRKAEKVSKLQYSKAS